MLKRTHLVTLALLSATLLLPVAAAQAQTIRYVDDDADPNGDGMTWPTAFRFLQDALEEAGQGDEIRVAGGTYKPDQDEDDPNSVTPGDRAATFELISGVGLYGGYCGLDPNCADPNDHDIATYETILSGDLNSDDGPDFANNDENSYQVVTGSGTNETAVLDGFTVTAGNADQPGSFHRFGGGMYNDGGSPALISCTFTGNLARDNGGGMYNTWGSSPTLSNCVFSGNSTESLSGAGMFNWEESSPTLINCTFNSNSAACDGGGVCSLWYSDPTLTNCTFTGNSANHRGGGMFTYCGTAGLDTCTFVANWASDYGGGMWNGWASTTITNCVFAGNRADRYGGGMFNWDNSSPILINCTFAENLAANGRAMASAPDEHRSPSNIEITNCILWDGGDEIWNNDGSTITVSFSDVQGGWPGEGNIDDDPLFGSACNSNYGLSPGSPCIDAGNNTAVPPDITTDLCGDPRFVDDPCTEPDTGNGDPPIVDMGAYEYQPCAGDLDCDGDTDHSDLGELLAAWCTQEGDPNWNPDADLDGDGHVGHGDLGILLADWGCGT